jgi:hypothetical protein
MVDLPMKIDAQTLALTVYYLRRVTPAGHDEQDELYGLINRLQSAGQSRPSCSMDSSHSHSFQLSS